MPRRMAAGMGNKDNSQEARIMTGTMKMRELWCFTGLWASSKASRWSHKPIGSLIGSTGWKQTKDRAKGDSPMAGQLDGD